MRASPNPPPPCYAPWAAVGQQHHLRHVSGFWVAVQHPFHSSCVPFFFLVTNCACQQGQGSAGGGGDSIMWHRALRIEVAMSQCRERTQKLKHKLQLSHKMILGPPFCLSVAIKRTNCLFPHRPTPPPLPTDITHPLPYSMYRPPFASNWCWQMSEFCGLLSIIQINLFVLPWGHASSAAAVYWIVQYLKYTNMSLKLYCNICTYL